MSPQLQQKIRPHNPQGPPMVKPGIMEVEGRSALRPVKKNMYKQPAGNMLEDEVDRKYSMKDKLKSMNKKHQSKNKFQQNDIKSLFLKKKPGNMETNQLANVEEKVPIDQSVLAELGMVKTHEDQEVRILGQYVNACAGSVSSMFHGHFHTCEGYPCSPDGHCLVCTVSCSFVQFRLSPSYDIQLCCS